MAKTEREDVNAFVSTYKFVHTNAVKLYTCTDVDNGEGLRYYDFTLLYPLVKKNGRYWIGHPEFISQPGQTNISKYFGFVKCTLLPPEKLYHPSYHSISMVN